MRSWIRGGYYTVALIIILLLSLLFLYQYKIKDFIEGDYSEYPQQVFENYADEVFNDAIYTLGEYKFDEMNELYITVLEEKKVHGSFTHYINQVTDTDDDESYEIYFVDKGKGVLGNGIFIREPNAEIVLKGKDPFKRVQKSFKIRLYDKEGLWHNQKIINLEKQEPDPLRIRNKLALDSFRLVNRMIAPRTSFVRLFVKDIKEDGEDTEFVDYGLYTQVEDVSRLYFASRGLEKSGYLYEINNFQFQDKSLVDLEEENKLNIKGENSPLLFDDLVYSINNPNKDIEEIVETYFDKEHLLNWMAINIIIGNRRFVDRDHYMYRPYNVDKWYFIPYDADDSFGRTIDAPKWEVGAGILYKNKLYERILTNKNLLEALNQTMDRVYSKINKVTLGNLLDVYYDEFFSNISLKPDIISLKMSYEDLIKSYGALADYPADAYQAYKESLKAPMPFKSEIVTGLDGQKRVLWEASKSLYGDVVSYKFEVSRDKRFTKIMYVKDNMSENAYDVPEFQQGTYYYRVTAINTNGYSTIMRDEHKDEFGNTYYGIKKFLVENK